MFGRSKEVVRDQVDCTSFIEPFLINSSTAKRLGKVERRGKKPCCREVSKEYWVKSASIFSLMIASSTLQTTNVRPMGLKMFGPVMRCSSATDAAVARRQ